MILIASKMGFEKENHELITFIVVSWVVMVIIVAFGLNISEGLFWGVQQLFLNMYISMINENSIEKFHI